MLNSINVGDRVLITATEQPVSGWPKCDPFLIPHELAGKTGIVKTIDDDYNPDVGFYPDVLVEIPGYDRPQWIDICFVKKCSGDLSPQAKRVLDHLKEAGSVTNVLAHAVLRVRSVSRRITELVRAGYTIHKEWKEDTTGQRYIKYVFVK